MKVAKYPTTALGMKLIPKSGSQRPVRITPKGDNDEEATESTELV